MQPKAAAPRRSLKKSARRAAIFLVLFNLILETIMPVFITTQGSGNIIESLQARPPLMKTALTQIFPIISIHLEIFKYLTLIMKYAMVMMCNRAQIIA